MSDIKKIKDDYIDKLNTENNIDKVNNIKSELFGKNGIVSNEFKKLGLPVIVGEWSLATDNCAMWLNGFQDNLPGYPNVICGYQNCPNPNTEIIDGSQGPFGSGISTPISGMCPVRV